jgi:hypothetical protein
MSRWPHKKIDEEKKQVTLPIAAKMMYESLADIAWRVEKEAARNKRPGIEKDDFYEYILQELGKDAFLYSFTPSGEIGSGDSDHRDNPQTPRISRKFYDLFNRYIGPNGEITKLFQKDGSNAKVQKNRLFRFKSSIINLVQLYVESTMKEYDGQKIINADGRLFDNEGKRVKGVKSKFNKSNETSFSYRQRKKNETDEDWFKYLLRIEMNRYLRLFVATFYMMVICDLFATDIDDMAKVIDLNDLANINSLKSDKLKFSKLKHPANRDQFVRNIQEIFTAKSIVKPIQKPGRPLKKGAEQLGMEIFGDEE